MPGSAAARAGGEPFGAPRIARRRPASSAEREWSARPWRVGPARRPGGAPDPHTTKRGGTDSLSAMTVAFFSGKRRRAAATLGAVSAGLLVLSGCDKPTPLATITVGTESVNSEATCYNDGKALPESKVQECLNKTTGKTVKVALDDKIRFGVDTTIAENGWTLFLSGQRAEEEPYKKTYRTIQAGAFFSSQTGQPVKEVNLSIVETKGSKVLGIWHFTLEKKS